MQKYPNSDRDIGLLRILQQLRSTGVAHAKGGNYNKAQKDAGLDRKTPRNSFCDLLNGVNQMLTDIGAHLI